MFEFTEIQMGGLYTAALQAIFSIVMCLITFVSYVASPGISSVDEACEKVRLFLLGGATVSFLAIIYILASVFFG